MALVVLLLIPAFKINPSEAEAKNLPGSGDAFQGRDALAAAGISAGALKPYVVLVEHGSTDQKRALVVKRLDQTDGVDGASAPSELAERRHRDSSRRSLRPTAPPSPRGR